MSNKTIFKRIALVAVAALGAGFLTVTPAGADDNSAVGEANATAATGVLNVATAPSTTGAPILGSAGALSGSKSLGLLANSTTQTSSSLTSTATMRADGAIVFAFKGSATAEIATTVEIDGGTIYTYSATASADVNMNAANTRLVVGKDATADLTTNFSVKPSTGASTFTVSVFESAALGTTDGGDASDDMVTKVAAIQAGTVSKGTLKQRYLVTVAATSASGVYSSTYSYVQAQLSTAIAAPTTNVDATSASASSTVIENSATSAGFISFDLRDAYNVSLSGKGALVVSATNGAGIALYNTTGGYGAASSVTLLSAVSNYATGTITVARPTAFANKGFSTTVTISWNGAVVGTKTIKFLGEVAKMTVGVDYIAKANDTTVGVGSIAYQDDAGNTLYPSTGTSATSASLNAFVTGASVGSYPSATDPFSYYDVSCGGSNITAAGTGSADVVFQHVNSVSGTVVKAAAVKITCAGDPTSFTASFDKAVYAPGDIATLTITGKDAKGNPANSKSQISTGSSTSQLSITTPANLTIVSAISTTSAALTSGDGIKTYKFIVGTTEGTFNAIVAIPNICGATGYNVAAGGAGCANATVKYQVAAPSTGAVTNAEVLAAIVKLIASINKQIRALQKSLKR